MDMQKLKADLVAADWTAEDLALNAGVRAITVRRILAGKIKKPQQRTVRAITEALEKRKFDASGSGLFTLGLRHGDRGDISELHRVIDWFRTLGKEDRFAVIAALDVYAGNVLGSKSKRSRRR
jgi:hypothetical protein